MKNNEKSPEKRDKKIREHLGIIEKDFPLLAKLVQAITSFDTSMVRHLAKELTQVINDPQRIIDKLKKQIADLKEENRKLQKAKVVVDHKPRHYPRIPPERGEVKHYPSAWYIFWWLLKGLLRKRKKIKKIVFKETFDF